MIHELVIDGAPTGKQHDFAGTEPPDFSEHPTKSAWVWLPVARDDDALGPGQIHNGERKAIEAGEVVYRRNARDKTAAELDAEARARRDPLDEIDALEARVAALET